MYEKIDFGTIGIKIGDIITFTLNGEKAKVVSGDGTPGNGGNLLNGNVAGYDGLVSITVATKKLACLMKTWSIVLSHGRMDCTPKPQPERLTISNFSQKPLDFYASPYYIKLN